MGDQSMTENEIDLRLDIRAGRSVYGNYLQEWTYCPILHMLFLQLIELAIQREAFVVKWLMHSTCDH